ncbi:sugar ABC transporter substrate-binding protein [Phytomonospora endophytica]|uniref:Multiple sugar transport system substrate-binding protein n=1 Tax=Phytomonospora endophytica TaxID=714109 RepID=A0A841FNI5_9ACTN|nr:sugar ABC transporter substrate-binding protein [Phytomonospora endophytica]MBB6034159.1 multiple sugar transport system substrate-binding protein [Phytomonospora endophytica]
MSQRRALLRLVVPMAALVVGLSVAGCGSSAAEQDSKGQLDIWVRKPPGTETEQTAKDLAAAFTEKTGVPTKVTAIFEDFETKLSQAAAQKQLPDIVINDTAQLGTLVKQGLVREIAKDSVEGHDQLTPISWDAATAADGKAYAVPFSAQTFALLIRKDWREKVGAGVPSTWDELNALATKFTKDDPDGNGEADTYGYVVPGSTKRGYTAWYFSSFLWAAGGDFFTGEPGKYTPAINSAASLAAVEWFQKSFCDGLVVPGAATLETTQAHPNFESGVGGIYLTGPYMMGKFDAKPGKDLYEVVPLPAGPGGAPAALAEGENVYLMAGSDNQDGQERFAEFAVSVEGQTLAMDGDQPGNIVRLPVNSTVDLASVRTDPRWQTFDDIYQSSARYVPQVPEWTPFLQSSAETLNAVVSNCDTPAGTALDELAATFAEELGRQGAGG